jgi:phosphoglycerate dehydrogenase-like enzyme
VLHREPLPDDDPLWAVPGLYITSHTAAPTDTAMVVDLFLDNLDRFRRGETLRGLVDFDRGY